MKIYLLNKLIDNCCWETQAVYKDKIKAEKEKDKLDRHYKKLHLSPIFDVKGERLK